MQAYVTTAGYVLDKNGNIVGSTDDQKLTADETKKLLDLVSHQTVGFLHLFGDEYSYPHFSHDNIFKLDKMNTRFTGGAVVAATSKLILIGLWTSAKDTY